MPLGAVSGNKASGRSGFKKGIDAEDRRKKREDARVSVRKQQREEALMKKRRDTSAPGTDAAAAEALTSLGASVTVPGETGTVEERLTLLPSMAESINCADPERQFFSCRLSREGLFYSVLNTAHRRVQRNSVLCTTLLHLRLKKRSLV